MESNQNDSMNDQPKKEISVKKSIAEKLSFTALFAALCCVGTLVIVIPLPYGYFNAGDIFVLLAGWCLGSVFGSFAAAIGSSLADVVLGYFAFESILYGIAGGAASLAGNALQGGFAVVCGTVLIACLYKITTVRGFFPCLGRVKHL